MPDPVRALQQLAAAMKRQMGFRLAAITGSAGKTTTKDFTAAILARRVSVEKTPGNQNSQIGFAMSIVNLPRRPDWMVGEMGLSAPGDLSRLSRTFEPDVAALLLVAPAHLEFFPSVDAIADAKAEILEGLRPDGTLVANADDPRIEAIAARRASRARVLRFGSAPSAEVTARDVVADAAGSRFRLKTPSGEADVRLPLPGPHQVTNFLAAAAIAFVVGLSPSDCAEAAGELRPAAHRGEWRPHVSGARIYDDSYNANPASMRAALETLAAVPAARRIAVLGDMLELGPQEEPAPSRDRPGSRGTRGSAHRRRREGALDCPGRHGGGAARSRGDPRRLGRASRGAARPPSRCGRRRPLQGVPRDRPRPGGRGAGKRGRRRP